jgi:hypothetical protein
MTVDDDFLKAQRQIVERLNLATGEQFGGVIPWGDAQPGQFPVAAHYLVLLPGEARDLTWDEATRWASSIGGSLPTPRELGLLLANDKALWLLKRDPWFQRAQYWTATEDPAGFTFAWSMGHLRAVSPHPSAGYDEKVCRLRARAVRRVRATEASTPPQGVATAKG